MRRLALVWLCLIAPLQLCADTIMMQFSVVRADTMVASLLWSGGAEGLTYQIYRQCPDEASLSLLATTSATTYTDSINRIVCGDTVFYQVVANRGTTHYRSAVEGNYFDDLWPTADCALRVATVDEPSQQIHLSWHESPDDDIMGYYLCTGSPCLDYDTVWGRHNTSYVCQDLLPTEPHEFRILAFDSCFKASPLTEPYNNIVLTVEGGACSRLITASWRAYRGMPQGVGRYTLFYANDGANTEFQPIATFDTTQTLSFSWQVPDTIFHFRMKVVAENVPQTLQSVSNIVHIDIVIADTAEFIEVSSVAHNTLSGCVDLAFRVDPNFRATDYNLYRREGEGAWHLLAQLPNEGVEQLAYSDCFLPTSDTVCHYRLSVFDSCYLYEKFSATASVLLPSDSESSLFLPNVFVPNDPNNALFCPIGSYLDSEVYEFDIYNRMGLLVFSSSRLGECWDGTYCGNPVPQGAYVYRIRYRTNQNREKIVVGTVLLLR